MRSLQEEMLGLFKYRGRSDKRQCGSIQFHFALSGLPQVSHLVARGRLWPLQNGQVPSNIAVRPGNVRIRANMPVKQYWYKDNPFFTASGKRPASPGHELGVSVCVIKVKSKSQRFQASTNSVCNTLPLPRVFCLPVQL